MNAAPAWAARACAEIVHPWWLLGGLLLVPLLAGLYLEPARAAGATPAVAALAAVVVLIVARPAWGGYALILLVYWNASDVIHDTWNFGWLLRATIVLAAGAGVLDRLLARAPRRLRFPLLGPLALYTAVQWISTVHAGDRAAALATLAEGAKGVTVFYLVTTLVGSPRAWRRGIDAVLAAVVLLAAPVVYQGITGSTFQFWGFGAMKFEQVVPGEWAWRLAGAVSDPNFLAMVLVAAMPLAAIVCLEPRAGWSRRGLALLALAGGLGATVFSYSRAAMLGLGFVLAALLWRHARRGVVLAATATALALAAALVPQAFLLRVVTLDQVSITRQQQEIADASIRIRRNELLAGWLMLEKNPLLGVGPGNYESEYLRYSAWVGLSGETTVRDPHSLYVQIAAETGLAGALAFAWLLLAAFRSTGRARRGLRGAGATQFADLLWALELSLATYLLLSLFLHGAYFRHFMVLLALAAVGAELARPAVTRAVPAEVLAARRA